MWDLAPQSKRKEQAMTNLKILGAVLIAASALCSSSPALAQWYNSNPAASEDEFGDTIGRPLSYGPRTGSYYQRRTPYRYPAVAATSPYAGGPYYGARVRAARAAYLPASCATGEGCVGQSANWNLVAAYRAGGPFYGYSGWADYKARNGIGCNPGTPGCQ
jgi:hypothetical protein